MVEAAIVLSFMIALTLGIIDAALLFVAYVETNRAVDRAARCAAVTYQMPTRSTACPDIVGYASSTMLVTKNVNFSAEMPSICGYQPSGSAQLGARVTGQLSYIPFYHSQNINITVCYPLSIND
jgi:hypothetical protein